LVPKQLVTRLPFKKLTDYHLILYFLLFMPGWRHIDFVEILVSDLRKATLSTARCIIDFWHIPDTGKNHRFSVRLNFCDYIE